MFEILMFLFENYMHENAALPVDRAALSSELEKVGFPPTDIADALSWLHGLDQNHQTVQFSPSTHSMRYYISVEAQHLGEVHIGFLSDLEKLGVLDPLSREIVIDRLMVLDAQDICISLIKWVALMVLFHQPERSTQLAVLRDLILTDAFRVCH